MVLDGNLLHFALMLTVTDLERSVAFYRDKFGFSVQEQVAFYALLNRETTNLYLVPESPPTPDKPQVTLAPPPTPDQTPINLIFRVRDCWAAYQELSARGVEFLTPPQQPEWGGWRCFTRDPDGYLIEIEQPE
jgi:catechol 2,3-dioxygenase-like lactoylglutathione lyase family enzyme